MSLGLILVIILVIFLLGGFSGRLGGYGYGYGHRGVGIIGIILIVILVLVLLQAAAFAVGSARWRGLYLGAGNPVGVSKSSRWRTSRTIMEVGTRLVVQTGCRPAFRSRLLGQPPRVAVLLELRDNMIRDGVAFVLGQGLLETTNDLRDRMTRHRKGQPDPASERPEQTWARSKAYSVSL
jgi:hypothetical protein